MEVNPPGSGMHLAARETETDAVEQLGVRGPEVASVPGAGEDVVVAVPGFRGKGVCAPSRACSGNAGCSTGWGRRGARATEQLEMPLACTAEREAKPFQRSS